MRTMGWPYPIRPTPWSDIEDHFEASGLAFGHMSAIVESVICSRAAANLAACTSMNDLLVTALPQLDPPDVVAVRTPSSGTVLIEHLSVTGKNDQIERPVDEAVPLFWRFMIEKFDIHPQR